MTGSHFTLKTHTTRIHIWYSLPFYYGLLVWTLCSFPTTCSCSLPLYILYFKFHRYHPIFTLTLIAHDLPSVNLCALIRSTKAWVYNLTLNCQLVLITHSEYNLHLIKEVWTWLFPCLCFVLNHVLFTFCVEPCVVVNKKCLKLICRTEDSPYRY